MTDGRDPLQSRPKTTEAAGNQEHLRVAGLMRRANVTFVNIGPHGK